MSTRRTPALVAAVLALAVVAAAGAWWFMHLASVPAAAPAAAISPVSVMNGLTVVEIKPSVQRASGLQEQTIGPAAATQGGATAYGVVMDLQPLLDWRGKYAGAQAQDGAARTQWGVARAELERQRQLRADDQNASLKSVQVAQAEEARAHSAAMAADGSLRALQADALQQFGPVLAGWARGGQGPMPQLAARHASLVGMALGERAPPRTLQVSLGSGPRWNATWIGRAARADPRLGAGLQVYLVPGSLPANASVIAALPAAATPDTTGVFVPLSAVVWYADQPWAYVRRDASHFARVPLLQATETPDGYIAHGGVAAGASVVTQGAGLLLSQEQTPPPNAAPCKDPECDD
jgi:membrane fusion protein, multidrug efflux system